LSKKISETSFEESFKTVKLKTSVPDSMRICVVDDDKFVVDMIARSLKMAGFHDISIYNSAERFIEENIDGGKEFSLVISDLVLPGVTGFDLCKKIKTYKESVPVILISGFDIEDVHSRVVDCGADDFVAKPFNPIELSTRVKLHLARVERAQSSVASTPLFRNSQDMPYIGDQIGTYVITDTIGWGRSSFIFKANSVKDKRTCALKILAAHAAGLKDMVSRFQNEVDTMQKIKHPNVVGFVDRGFYNSSPYVVMEYIDGLDLEEYIITKGKIPLQNSFAIAHGIASAIAEVHANNIIHRDIKLKNIIFDIRSKAPKLIDFGIAQTAESQHLTRDGFVVGTPIYMAPEIFEGESATIKTDIYSFGATVYHLITGSPPFVGDSSKELYRKHLSEAPPPMSKFRHDIPEEIERIISISCLAKKPSDRPESMKDVEKSLGTFVVKLSK